MKHLFKLTLLLLAVVQPVTTIATNINFVDANVKALCVQNWDTDGDGELSEAEAAAVTSIGTVFKSDTIITSFDEFQYFVGLAETGYQAFMGCSALTSVRIPNSVTKINGYTFRECTSLSNVYIPNSVTLIGNCAFHSCTALKSIFIPCSVNEIGDRILWRCTNLANITVDSDNLVFDSRDNSNAIIETETNTLVVGCQNSLIPNTVTEIGDYAFQHCTLLTSIVIPNSVTTIGDYAYNGCSGLTRVDIGNATTTIGKYAFYDCSNLVKVSCLATTPPAINHSYTFPTAVTSQATLYVPRGTKTAYQAADYWKNFNRIEDMIVATTIELDKSETELTEGNYFQLKATVLPEDATNKAVTWTSSNKDVATVSQKGLVTAVAPGSAMITVMTIDGSDLSATCAVTVTKAISDSDNFLSMHDITASRGDTIVVPVAMTNAASIISFQTDIFLPEGLEVLLEDGEYMINASNRMTRTHGIMSNAIASGAIRVICYSSNYKPFTGNSGDDLFYITIKVADDAKGDYSISLRNTLFTTSDFEEVSAPDTDANVTVKTYPLGDANGSYTVTVTDVVVTSKYILEMNPSPFIFENADVNADGNITVTDVSLIAYLAMNATLNAPRRTPALTTCNDRMSSENVTLTPGENSTVSIALDNEMDYCAFQIDLTLPEGLTARNFTLSDRADSHAFEVNRLSNGKLRALCYSPSLEAIDGNSGTLLTFDVCVDGVVNGDIIVDGIELVTIDCVAVKLDLFTIGVNNFTAVNEVTTGKTVERVDYYNLAGQRIERPKGGVTLVVTTYTDGTRITAKIIQ